MPQEDTPASITPLNNTLPSQYQQSIILDDTDKDSHRPKAKKALAFADTHYENLFVSFYRKYHYSLKFNAFSQRKTLL